MSIATTIFDSWVAALNSYVYNEDNFRSASAFKLPIAAQEEDAPSVKFKPVPVISIKKLNNYAVFIEMTDRRVLFHFRDVLRAIKRFAEVSSWQVQIKCDRTYVTSALLLEGTVFGVEPTALEIHTKLERQKVPAGALRIAYSLDAALDLDAIIGCFTEGRPFVLEKLNIAFLPRLEKSSARSTASVKMYWYMFYTEEEDATTEGMGVLPTGDITGLKLIYDFLVSSIGEDKAPMPLLANTRFIAQTDNVCVKGRFSQIHIYSTPPQSPSLP